MERGKRIEIVTNALEMRQVITLLAGHDIVAYTLVPGVVGRGEQGLQAGDDLTDASRNSYLLTTCRLDQLDRLVDALRRILRRFGGIYLVSDAQWIVY